MAIEVTQIIGDTVELVFNPAEEDLHVGENLSVRGRHENRGLIVQVIEIKAFFSASLLFGHDRCPSVGPPLAAPAIANPRARSPRRRNTPQPAPDIHESVYRHRQDPQNDGSGLAAMGWVASREHCRRNQDRR